MLSLRRILCFHVMSAGVLLASVFGIPFTFPSDFRLYLASLGVYWSRFLAYGIPLPAFARIRTPRSQRLHQDWAGCLVLPFRYSRLWQLRKSFDLLFISICLLVYCVFCCDAICTAVSMRYRQSVAVSYSFTSIAIPRY